MSTHPLHNLKGEQKEQLLILVDKLGNQIGTASRALCHKGDGKAHLAFMAFVLDKNQQIILTRRSKKKSLWPGYWDGSVVSHVLPDETVTGAANRRGKEELGIDVDFKDRGAFYYFIKHGNSAENEYCHVLVGSSDEEIYHNPQEIDQIRLIRVDELKRELKASPLNFTPWLQLAIKKFEIR